MPWTVGFQPEIYFIEGNMEPAIAEQSFDRAMPAWTANGISPEKGILMNIELAMRAGGVKQPVPTSQVVDWSFVEAELKAGAAK